jgi:hypothetical protein
VEFTRYPVVNKTLFHHWYTEEASHLHDHIPRIIHFIRICVKIFTRPLRSVPSLSLKSPLFTRSHDLGGLMFWTGQRPRPNCLGLITNQAQMAHLTVYSQHTPSPWGGARSNRDQFKRIVTSLYQSSHESLTGDYTSHNFVTAGYTCAWQQLCIQPPLYKGDSSQSLR